MDGLLTSSFLSLWNGVSELPETTQKFYDLNHNNILLSSNSSLHLLDTLDTICLKLNHQLPCNYTIGIGQSVTILSQMKASYQTGLRNTDVFIFCMKSFERVY